MKGQHTPGAPPRRFTERKVKAGGTVQEFDVTLVHRAPGLVVVRFIVPAPGGRPGLPVQLPGGAISDGYFWEDRPYNVYRMRTAAGALLCHRFDALDSVEITETSVTYRDLIYDWWLLPDGRLIEEDEDEFREAEAAGLLTARDLRVAGEAVAAVRARAGAIAEECGAIEGRFERGP